MEQINEEGYPLRIRRRRYPHHYIRSNDPELKLFMDKGFSSTSKESDIALAFGFHYMRGADYITMLKIHAPSGTKVIYVGNSYAYTQQEVILVNNSMFHINNTSMRNLTESELKLLYNEGLDLEMAKNIKVKIYDVDYVGDTNS